MVIEQIAQADMAELTAKLLLMQKMARASESYRASLDTLGAHLAINTLEELRRER